MDFIREKILEIVENYLKETEANTRVSHHFDIHKMRQLSQKLRHHQHFQNQALSEKEQGQLLEEVMERTQIGIDAASPFYCGYIPGGGLPIAAYSNLLSEVINRFANVDFGAPLLAEVEMFCLKFFIDLFHFNAETSRGQITSGGSLANFIAVLLARERFAAHDYPRLTVYSSQYTHYSLKKAVKMSGIPLENLRSVNNSLTGEIDLVHLRSLIEDDRRQGLLPCLLVGNAGSTNTGSIDPLEALADQAREFQLHFHVDAAYGGPFILTEEVKEKLRGIERADSITLDPHKGFFLPYGTGIFIAQDGERLKQTFSISAEYITNSFFPFEKDEIWDFQSMSPELSREFRGLRLFMSLKCLGIDFFKNELEKKLQLKKYLVQKIQTLPGVEVVPSPLTIINFRAQEKNQEWHELILQKQRGFFATTTLHGQVYLRICLLSFRTQKEHMEEIWQHIESSYKISCQSSKS